jgi:DNA-binding NarL/FixJ family response regulator
MPIRVALYEDNPALREALIILISSTEALELVGAYEDCQAVEKDLSASPCDVVLMDIELPGRSGIEGTYLIKKRSPATEVLILTVFEDDEAIFQAICAGASGYLLKKTPPSRILAAIEDVHAGEVPMTPSIARRMLALFPKTPGNSDELDKLSAREQEVLKSLAKGNSYKMAAAELRIGINTIRSHVKRIYEKLHVHSISEAIAKTFLKQ